MRWAADARIAAEISCPGRSGRRQALRAIPLRAAGSSRRATDVAARVFSLYLLRCADGSLYTGIATDVRRRLCEHESGSRGARYLRGRGPLELVLERRVGDRALASRIEHRVKRLPRLQKERLVRRPERLDELLRSLDAEPA